LFEESWAREKTVVSCGVMGGR